MRTKNDSKVKEEVWQVIKSVNRAWQVGEPQKELQKYFHENIVIVPPGFSQRAEGRDVCIKSYVDFLSKAKVKEFKESEPMVDVFADTAVVYYRYDITLQVDDKTSSENGHNVYVLNRNEGQWRIVWRTLVPTDSKEGKEL